MSHPPASPQPWESYTYTPTERHIFLPSPYKSHLLPLWRFKTPAVAQDSANAIWAAFLKYEEEDDFVGMDNARKFLQVGMTRAGRYANWRGGRKYCKGGDRGVEKGEGREGGDGGMGGGKKRVVVDEEEGWEGRKEKEEARDIFREVWERAKGWEGYVRRKEEFLVRQREWKRSQGEDGKSRGVRKKRKMKGEGGKGAEEGD